MARIIVRIELTPGARKRLDECSEKSGMTQVAMLSRLVEWFSRQPEAVRHLVVGSIPEELKEQVAGLVLKTLAKGSGRTES